MDGDVTSGAAAPCCGVTATVSVDVNFKLSYGGGLAIVAPGAAAPCWRGHDNRVSSGDFVHCKHTQIITIIITTTTTM